MSDLEHRLAELQKQGVQASKEIQLAAQHVVRENSSLRELLGLAGFSPDEINAWVRVSGCAQQTCAKRRACERKARECATSRAGIEGVMEDGSPPCGAVDSTLLPAPNPVAGVLTMYEDVGGGASPRSSPSETSMRLPSIDSLTGPHQQCSSVPSLPGLPRPQVKGQAPCKLLLRHHDGPGTDSTTQISADPTGPVKDCQTKGVECGKAYEMLARFATSEEKIDNIARSLEEGCTLDGRGGCAVRQDVVWKVLDTMCG